MGQINELKDFTRGQLDAALMKIGQDAGMRTAEGIKAFLAGDLIISKPRWREKNGVIYFSVTSDGTTGDEWSKHLTTTGFHFKNDVHRIFLSNNFKPTIGVTTNVAILKGTLFNDDNRMTKNIRARAQKRGLEKPSIEIVCLIRKKFTDEELSMMGLFQIVIMHEPVENSEHIPLLLEIDSIFNERSIKTVYGDLEFGFTREFDDTISGWTNAHGFAFAVPQTSQG